MYVGRFAPSPTGPLHFGSLVAAVASWLDARAQGGRWLVRIEDLDKPREQPGAAAEILRTLERSGLYWDGTPLFQSRNLHSYATALERLQAQCYGCACTRKEIADSSLGLASDGAQIYPGTCRHGIPAGRAARAIRIKVPTEPVSFDDRVQGRQTQDLAHEVGDFILRRADGAFSYQLAVVVDDAEQGVTDVVRGADLLDSTARQIYLQRLLGYPQPRYLHVPVAVNAAGEKLSKQTGAQEIDDPKRAIGQALRFLNQNAETLDEALRAWDAGAIPRKRAQRLPKTISRRRPRAGGDPVPLQFADWRGGAYSFPSDSQFGGEMQLARFSRHDPASAARYQESKRLAVTQTRVLAGTPGTLKRRTRRGTEYWVREHIRLDGRKVDEYLGTAEATSEKRLRELRAEVEVAKALASGSSTLRLLGYQRTERNSAAVLAALFNRGLFAAGLTLVGSHAYGVLLNEMGIAAPGYRTRDIDLARGQRLALATATALVMQELLDESGLAFQPVPGMPSHRPSGSFKVPGADALAVDLLVPGSRLGTIVEIRELGAHAQTVPLLEFLITEPIDAVILSPNQVVPVRVPAPERFVLHKLYSSQSRHGTRDKARKDLEQAAVLAAAVEEETPGRLAEAYRAFPPRGRQAVRAAIRPAATLLGEAHAEARRALAAL